MNEAYVQMTGEQVIKTLQLGLEIRRERLREFQKRLETDLIERKIQYKYELSSWNDRVEELTLKLYRSRRFNLFVDRSIEGARREAEVRLSPFRPEFYRSIPIARFGPEENVYSQAERIFNQASEHPDLIFNIPVEVLHQVSKWEAAA